MPGAGGVRQWGLTANVYRVPFWGVGNFLKLDSEYTKKHGIVSFIWVNFILLGIYLNKAFSKEREIT